MRRPLLELLPDPIELGRDLSQPVALLALALLTRDGEQRGFLANQALDPREQLELRRNRREISFTALTGTPA